MKRDQEEQFKKALFAARVEREKLIKEAVELDEYRAYLEYMIDHTEQTVHSLSVLVGEDETVDFNSTVLAIDGLQELPLADACRIVMEASDRFVSPVRVRNDLRAAGYPLKEHKNPLATIHGILKRFEESGEAESLKVGGKTGYRLTGKKAKSTRNHDITHKRIKRAKPELSLLEEGSLKD